MTDLRCMQILKKTVQQEKTGLPITGKRDLVSKLSKLKIVSAKAR